MRVLYLLLQASCLLVCVASSDFASLFSKNLKTVASPISSAADAVSNSTLAAASTAGAAAETFGSASVTAAKSIGKPVEQTVVSVGTVSGQAAETVGQGVQKEVQAAKQPVDLTVAYVGSSQCQNVQKLAGVSYDQMQGENEPNMNTLELVYKTKNFRTVMNITDAPASLRQARTFDNDSKLVVYLHGFTDDPSKDSFETISDSYLSREDTLSILALDASSHLRWFYIRAATLVHFVGNILGEVLAIVHEQGQDPKLIHLVGHSLGSHIAAFTGKAFRNITGELVGRITGLDPAGPCFSHVDPELRLKRTDAAYVDVMHTDAGAYGIADAVGHKDYMPNSGALQPNCLFQTCSHSRAWQLYAESVRDPAAFPAVRCNSWAAFKKGDCEWDKISYMGHSSQPGDEGLYFLQTGANSPYGLGMNGTKYENNEAILRNVYNTLG